MSKGKANPEAVPMRQVVERIRAWHAETPMDPPGDMTLTAGLTALADPISARLEHGWTAVQLHAEFVRLGLSTSLTTFRVTLGQVRKAKANSSTPERKPRQSKPSRDANAKSGEDKQANDEAIDGRPPSAGMDATPSASNDRIDSLRVDPPYPDESPDPSTSADEIAASSAGKSEDEATSTETPQQGSPSTSDDVDISAGRKPIENGAATRFVTGDEQAGEIVRATATKPDIAEQADIATSVDIVTARRDSTHTDRAPALDKSNADFPTPMPNRRKLTES
jgi:hypothetical protein